jgi:hypothetical protein
MAKPNFPSKTCPKCHKLIHARSKSHEECGWVMGANTGKRGRRGRKPGRKAGSGMVVTLADIEAVKALADRLGADKVGQLASVLAK